MMFSKLFNNLLLLLLLITVSVSAQEWERVLRLEGRWQFSIGDKEEWSSPDYDDSQWERVFVPAAWEDEGFHGYNGYAWYRTEFSISDRYKENDLYLFLGYVDDVDEVYINGKKIGTTGKFPPKFETAYSAERQYSIPNGLLNFDGDNVIAVRVFDYRLNGGITSGKIGIYSHYPELRFFRGLRGEWKFRTGDNPEWKNTAYNDSKWNKIYVPGNWEEQGFYEYNGFAWYRLEFNISDKLAGKDLVFIAGKIDDIDQVYLNGNMIGSTGNMTLIPVTGNLGNYWQELRGYEIPAEYLKKGKNLIAIRIYDGQLGGGIYQGPVGIIEKNEYLRIWGNQNNSFWDQFFE